MTDGQVVIPVGEKLIHKSDLFDVRIRERTQAVGLLGRTRFFLLVEILEQDPLLQRMALLEVPEDVWRSVSVGEQAQARLYEDPNTKQWSHVPPVSHG